LLLLAAAAAGEEFLDILPVVAVLEDLELEQVYL
jgi:hypothetical protein